MDKYIEDILLDESDLTLKISCLIRKSVRARRISLRIRSRELAILTLPRWASYKEGYSFLEKQKKWLGQAIKKFPTRCSLGDYFMNKGKIWLGSNYHYLDCFKKSDIRKAFHEIYNHQIFLYIPEDQEIDDSILNFLHNLARENLSMRTKVLSDEVSLSCKKLRIGNQRSRWGSCSEKGTISLNWRLILLKYELANYIIFHELAHLKHLNHSKEFWEFLSVICPDALSLDTQLKTEGKAIITLGQ